MKIEESGKCELVDALIHASGGGQLGGPFDPLFALRQPKHVCFLRRLGRAEGMQNVVLSMRMGQAEQIQIQYEYPKTDLTLGEATAYSSLW